MLKNAKNEYRSSFYLSLRCAFSLFAVLGLVSPLYAFSLGSVQIESASGEPFSAKIPIVVDEGDEVPSLRVSIATSAQYQQQGLSRVGVEQGVRVSLVNMSNGGRYILLRSDRPINVDNVDLLLNVRDQNSSGLRRFSIAIKGDQKTAQELPTQLGTALSSEQNKATAKTLSAKNNATQITSVQRSRGGLTVRRGQTLGGIARSLKAPNVTTKQMLLALQRANPHAFIRGNMNLVKAGAVLTVPDATQAQSINIAEAKREYAEQAQAFREGRTSLRRVEPESAATETRRQSQGKVGQTPSVTPDQTKQATPRSDSDPALPVPLSKEDRLELSGSDDRLDQAAEELVAKSKALEEADSRVKELEKNVADMQKLLAQQNKALARSAKNAEELNDKLENRSLIEFLRQQNLLIYVLIGLGLGLLSLVALALMWWRSARKNKSVMSLLSQVDDKKPTNVLAPVLAEPLVDEASNKESNATVPDEESLKPEDSVSSVAVEEVVVKPLNSEAVEISTDIPELTVAVDDGLANNTEPNNGHDAVQTSDEIPAETTASESAEVSDSAEVSEEVLSQSGTVEAVVDEDSATEELTPKPLNIDFDLDLNKPVANADTASNETTEDGIAEQIVEEPPKEQDSQDVPVVDIETDVAVPELDEEAEANVSEMFSLVSAYIEIDDKNSALEILQEITQKGSAEQRKRAQEIISDLTSSD